MTIPEIHSLFKTCTEACTDTRKISEGSMFFALKGERFNGNDFALQALANGASYAVVDEKLGSDDERLIHVVSVLHCLQDLAKYHREQLNIPFIGITGSNGKTTSKELIRDVLKNNYAVHATFGNLNNHIGVPLTLLEVNENHELAIIEMGANHIGEIALLSSISSPDIGLITNIGKAHIGEFGGFENIIKGKTELYDHLSLIDGLAFVNGESEILMEKSLGLRRHIYGQHQESEVVTQIADSELFLHFKWNDRLVKTNLIGDYNLSNINAAICLANHFNIPDSEIIDAIESYDPDNNRSQLLQKGTKKIIMDAYNANPTSMNAAIENLGAMKAKKKFAILGHMLELGEDSSLEHSELIEVTRSKNIPAVFIGSKFTDVETLEDVMVFESLASARGYIQSIDLENSLILVKGSRGIELEKVLDFL
ncbi:MAG: UDP-N-acetylmuramoyl-tripeptide--D-alanyl-D-alanine ligase [Flavobacteriales bacterium]|nr:UDP-N-acetylmuramoyl-tripeptide--D-alanyl-D-alanine ligase [Flavobacteriales bacterium]